MKLRALPGLAVLTLLTPLTVAPPLHAEGLGPALVRILDRPGRVHPLADARGRIPVTVKLPPTTDPASLGLLEVAPGIGAIRLDPEDVGIFAEAHPELTLEVGPRLKPLLDKSAGLNRLASFVTEATTVASGTGTGKDTGTGKGVAVGIVDTGIDIMHPDFRDAQGKTRIAWLLYELPAGQSSAGLHPDLESQFGCAAANLPPCTIYAAADIDALIAKGGGGIDDPVGHGTHVASIAAGNGGVMSSGTPTYIGMASEATLIVAAAGGDSGYSTDEVLRGTNFVFEQAASMNMPVAANFSIGTVYGPHDGTSSLETGLAGFVGDSYPGRVMVASVGNTGGFYGVSDPTSDGGILTWNAGTHTDVYIASGEVVRVPLVSPAAPATTSQLDIWIAWKAGSDVSVALEGPDHSLWVPFQSSGQQNAYQDPTNGNIAGVVNDVTDSDVQLTASNNSAAVVIGGPWTDFTQFAIQLRGQGYADLWVDSTTDIAAPGGLFLEADENGSVTIPATAPSIISAGCTINRSSWIDYEGDGVNMVALQNDPTLIPDNSCAFSARGPTRTGLAKPEIGAPGGYVVGAMSSAADPRSPEGQGGILDQCPVPGACMVVDDHHAVAQGTSMSAPQVTGAAALLLEVDPTLTQAHAAAALQAGARLPAVSLDDPDQLGVGALSIAGALDALLGQTGGEPNATQSWYTLSNNYVQPDPTWPIWGMIELRDQSSSIATVDETKLHVSFEGGLVLQQPKIVSGSTFQFSVAAPTSSVGATLVLDVTYAGVSLGPRQVPVGQDTWRAHAPLVAGGGTCSLEALPAERQGGAPLTLSSGLLLAALLIRRRTSNKNPDDVRYPT